MVRSEDSSMPKMYLEKLVSPEASHFCWKVGESHNQYSGRLKSYEKCVYTQLLHTLAPLQNPTSERLILVSSFSLRFFLPKNFLANFKDRNPQSIVD